MSFWKRGAGHRPRLALLAVALVASAILVACGDDGDDAGTDVTTTATTTPPATATTTATASATATATATESPATSTSTPDATATPGEDDEGPSAPTNVRLSGSLPDTTETVTPGEAETGRVTVEWDYDDGVVTGFRVYQRECDGTVVGEPIEIEPAERQYGPLQPCRPGGDIGVSALDDSGESEIAWSQD